MSGGIPNPDTDRGEIIGYGDNFLKDDRHVISQFNNENSAQSTILFSNRKAATRVRIRTENDKFFTA